MEEKKNNAIEKIENIVRAKNKSAIKEDAAKKEETLARERYEKKETEDRINIEREREKSEKDGEKKQKGKNKNGGLIAAVISLGIATLILASALTMTFLMPTENDNALEGEYRRSFYDTVSRVDNMDLNLSKILATKDDGAKQEYLMDLAVNSELAENSFQSLPVEDESKFYTTKLVNQIGDFAKYLNKKLVNGEELTNDDYAVLLNLYEANKNLKNSLQKIRDGMSEKFNFTDLKEGDDASLFITELGNLENLSVEFPELIYDGPFSDGANDREIKGLTGDDVSKEDAEKEFIKIFGNAGVSDVKFDGETAEGIICYNFSATKKGDTLYAEISKTGGKLVMFAYSGSCNSVNIEEGTAIKTALEFAENAGISGLKPVWINLNNNLYTINFAFSQDGVIVYSDLVKIRVCAETNTVIGYEATSYYINHTERTIGSPALSLKTCEEKVSDNIEIESSRLCVVPIGEKTEKLCYEFCGTYDGATYYAYIDAESGRQVNMFKVIESTEGKLLL